MLKNQLDVDVSTEDLKKLHLLIQLLDTTPAYQLRQSIHEIYHTYLIQNHEMLPLNFTQISSNMYHLFNFLDSMETNSDL